ncbi:MAG TPA: succino-amino-deoxyadenylate synthase PurZ [Actinomycetota bacterium]|nr:succino-amino-deoxyadenylate synthase PurZ [Actinomycetota bacterium]
MTNKAGRVTVVVGGQFGSEAKGHVAARAAREDRDARIPHVAVRVAGPNAGHTAYDDLGHKFAFRALPVAAVIDPTAQLVVSAGSEIEIEVLRKEIEWAERCGHDVRERLWIDAQATILTDRHKDAESFAQLTMRLGSTGKGIGAARSERIMRTAEIGYDYEWELRQLGHLTSTAPLIADRLRANHRVLIEGTQGYGLGLHAGYYPKCTSSDCRAIDFLAMAGISPWQARTTDVIIVCRYYPIRVAGDSGHLYGETSWEDLGLEPELTTVTKKVRRVGLWDEDLVRRAVEANGGPASNVHIALTMVDQRWPEVAGLDGDFRAQKEKIPTEALDFIQQVEDKTGADVVAIGTGPRTMVVA